MNTPLVQILTTTRKATMIAYLKAHPEDFGEAVALSLDDHHPCSWRAAWLLWSCMEENDARLEPHIGKFIGSLSTAKDNRLRETLIILRRMDLDEAATCQLVDPCVLIWKMSGKQPSVKYTAFRLLVKLAKKHPGLSNEIMLLADSPYTDTLSANTKRAVLRLTASLLK